MCMITFAHHIEESLNSSYPIEVEEKMGRSTFYSFRDDHGLFCEMEFRLYPDGKVVDVSFVRGGSIRPTRDTSTAKALKIYATIGSQLRKFLDAHKDVRKVMFDAAHKDMVPVYERLARRIASQLGGKVVTDPTYSGHATSWEVQF